MIRAAAATTLALLVLTGCSGGSGVSDGPVGGARTSAAPASRSATVSASPSRSPARSSARSPARSPASSPPAWLGTRPLPLRPDGYGEVRRTPHALRHRAFTLPDTLPELPGRGFTSRVVTPPPAAVVSRSTWQPGCPVAATDLAWVRLTFRGFDHRRHTGELLVDRSAARDVVSVFRQLYAARFPLEAMRITTLAELDAPPTGDGNVTESFVCRPTVGQTSSSQTVFSQHAYGLAVDVDPFQNPYTKGDLVIPELASSYLRRDPARPGVITPDGVVVRAFASVGWTWGGTWSSLKDYQHFSRNGR